jgi:hypothetical protein
MAYNNYTGATQAKTALLTNIKGMLSELYTTYVTEIENARDGESTLLDQINVLQASITALSVGSGCPVSTNDASAGTLSTKLTSTGGTITLTEVNDGGNETLNLDLAGGGTDTTSSGTDITLTSSSNQVQYITTTAADLSVSLPDATDLNEGACTFFLINAGDYDYGVKDDDGDFVCAVRSKGFATLSLADNSTAAGTWQAHNDADLIMLYTKTVLNTDTAQSYLSSCKLTATETFVAWQGTDSDGFCAVVTYSGGTYSISNILEFDTTAASYIDCCRMTDTVAIVGYNGGASTYGIAKAITYDGTDTLTETDSYDFKTAEVEYINMVPVYEDGSAGKVGVVYRVADPDFDIQCQILDWDGANLTEDTAETEIFNHAAGSTVVADLVSGAVGSASIVCVYDDGDSADAIMIAWDGSTITKGTGVALISYGGYPHIKNIDADYSVGICQAGWSDRRSLVVFVLKHTGTTVSVCMLKGIEEQAFNSSGPKSLVFDGVDRLVFARNATSGYFSDRAAVYLFRVVPADTFDDCTFELIGKNPIPYSLYTTISGDTTNGITLFYDDNSLGGGDGYLACQKVEIGG